MGRSKRKVMTAATDTATDIQPLCEKESIMVKPTGGNKRLSSKIEIEYPDFSKLSEPARSSPS